MYLNKIKATTPEFGGENNHINTVLGAYSDIYDRIPLASKPF
jgi:hypothetical protein